MNHYKYITLSILDLSSSELVHSVTSFENTEEGEIIISARPIKYFVNSDNMEELLNAKTIMEELLNNIYEVEIMSDRYDNKDMCIMKKVPAYYNNLHYYNIKLISIKCKSEIYKAFKKLNKNRFEVVEEFTNKKPEEIETYDAEGYF